MSLLPPRWASSTAHVWQKWSSVWPVKEYLTGMLCPSLTPALSSRCSPTGSGLRCVHVRVLYSLEFSTNRMMFFIEEHLIFTYTKTQSRVLLSYVCLKTIFNSLHWLFSYIISEKQLFVCQAITQSLSSLWNCYACIKYFRKLLVLLYFSTSNAKTSVTVLSQTLIWTEQKLLI